MRPFFVVYLVWSLYDSFVIKLSQKTPILRAEIYSRIQPISFNFKGLNV